MNRKVGFNELDKMMKVTDKFMDWSNLNTIQHVVYLILRDLKTDAERNPDKDFRDEIEDMFYADFDIDDISSKDILFEQLKEVVS